MDLQGGLRMSKLYALIIMLVSVSMSMSAKIYDLGEGYEFEVNDKQWETEIQSPDTQYQIVGDHFIKGSSKIYDVSFECYVSDGYNTLLGLQDRNTCVEKSHEFFNDYVMHHGLTISDIETWVWVGDWFKDCDHFRSFCDYSNESEVGKLNLYVIPTNENSSIYILMKLNNLEPKLDWHDICSEVRKFVRKKPPAYNLNKLENKLDADDLKLKINKLNQLINKIEDRQEEINWYIKHSPESLKDKRFLERWNKIVIDLIYETHQLLNELANDQRLLNQIEHMHLLLQQLEQIHLYLEQVILLLNLNAIPLLNFN